MFSWPGWRWNIKGTLMTHKKRISCQILRVCFLLLFSHNAFRFDFLFCLAGWCYYLMSLAMCYSSSSLLWLCFSLARGQWSSRILGQGWCWQLRRRLWSWRASSWIVRCVQIKLTSSPCLRRPLSSDVPPTFGNFDPKFIWGASYQMY